MLSIEAVGVQFIWTAAWHGNSAPTTTSNKLFGNMTNGCRKSPHAVHATRTHYNTKYLHCPGYLSLSW